MGFVSDVASGAIASVLVLAGLSKVGRTSTAASAWAAHGILPARLVPFLARAVGPLELVVAAAVVLPETRREGLAAAIGLFAAYAVYLATAVRRGVDGGCGCFRSDTAQTVNAVHVARAAALAAVGVLAIAGTNEMLDAPALMLGGVAGTGLVLAASLLVTLADVALRRSPRRGVSA